MIFGSDEPEQPYVNDHDRELETATLIASLRETIDEFATKLQEKEAEIASLLRENERLRNNIEEICAKLTDEVVAKANLTRELERTKLNPDLDIESRTVLENSIHTERIQKKVENSAPKVAHEGNSVVDAKSSSDGYSSFFTILMGCLLYTSPSPRDS